MAEEPIRIYYKAVREGLTPEQMPKLLTVNPKLQVVAGALRENLAKPRLIMAEVGVQDPFERVDFITPDEKKDLLRIPRWAMVAFAGRCAQRGLPNTLLPHDDGDLGRHFSALDQTVDFVMECAEKGRIGELPPLREIQFYPEYPDSAVIAVVSAAMVPFGLKPEDSRLLAALAADHANWAVWWNPRSETTRTGGYRVVSATNAAIWEDFGKLSEAALLDDWTDATAVPRSFFQTPDVPKWPIVFLCHAKADTAKAMELYTRLRAHEMDPWLDKYKLVLGDDWKTEIEKAVWEADCFVVCLRPGFDKIGFRQQEVRWALEAHKLRPPGRGFLIPFFVEPCPIPDWLGPFHAGGDPTRPTSFEDLLTAVKKHCGVGTDKSKPANIPA